MAAASVLQRKRDVRFRHVPPETVVIRQAGPEVLVLNAVAGRVVELCDGRTPLAGVVDTLTREYDVDRAGLEHDVLGFARELVAAEVLEESDHAG